MAIQSATACKYLCKHHCTFCFVVSLVTSYIVIGREQSNDVSDSKVLPCFAREGRHSRPEIST